jgi:small-conductance mechanosensitive channel
VRLALSLQGVPAQATPSPTPPAPAAYQISPDWIAAQWPAVVQALIVVLVTYIAVRVVQRWVGSAMRRARVDTGTQILVRRGITVAIIVIGALIVLGALGVSTAGLVTVVGTVGLAFSLAIQDILKNFFSGVYLLLERPFRVGDTIKVKDQEGVVENIGVRTTTLRTVQNVRVMVPNAMIFAEVVANESEVSEPQTAAPPPQGPA